MSVWRGRLSTRRVFSQAQCVLQIRFPHSKDRAVVGHSLPCSSSRAGGVQKKRRCALWDLDKGISTSCAVDSIHLCNIWGRALSLTTWRQLHVKWVSGSTSHKRSYASLGGGGDGGVLVKLPASWFTTGKWMPFCLGVFSLSRLWQAESLRHLLMCCFDALRGIPSCYFECVLWNLTPAESTLFNISLSPHSNPTLLFSLQQSTRRLELV